MRSDCATESTWAEELSFAAARATADSGSIAGRRVEWVSLPKPSLVPKMSIFAIARQTVRPAL
jgi:hypothetical protein